MGFDTSFHPVDLSMVRERLLPYIAGTGDDGDLDDLLDRAVAVRRTRFEAKQWAVGAIHAAKGLGVDAFDTRLHVWGRPFFVTGDDPAQVTHDVGRYLAATPDEVPALAREMLGRLHPRLAAETTPSTEGVIPDDAALREHMSWRMRILRAAGGALRNGRSVVRDPDTGREHTPGDLIDSEVPFSVLEFVAMFHPGWMSRGYTWPTRVCAEAGVDDVGFGAPVPLFDALTEAFPGRSWVAAPTITGNYAVGGLVPPHAVGEARANLRTNRGALLAPAEADGWGDSLATDLAKTDEALAYAEAHGFAFCEATEIYSGMEG
ncbi:hypothetical protein, partial [Yinghuangia sp. YIM S09857]|uniref:hypothetical protein n=1 Tax=Yinghuangia sp. YIM S09857 TaxID=3436929 RepID=UPI003F5317D9